MRTHLLLVCIASIVFHSECGQGAEARISVEAPTVDAAFIVRAEIRYFCAMNINVTAPRWLYERQFEERFPITGSATAFLIRDVPIKIPKDLQNEFKSLARGDDKARKAFEQSPMVDPKGAFVVLGPDREATLLILNEGGNLLRTFRIKSIDLKDTYQVEPGWVSMNFAPNLANFLGGLNSLSPPPQTPFTQWQSEVSKVKPEKKE